DEGSSLTQGEYSGSGDAPHVPIEFSGSAELAKAMAFSVPRGQEGPSYFRGKICYGLWRRDVLDGIRGRIGRVFPPINPDYTSRIAALATAPSFVDAGVPLQLSIMSSRGTGWRVARDPREAGTFLDEIDPGLVHNLPIPGLYTSTHNIVAHDYLLAEELGD